MRRLLSAEERALWQRVIADVTPALPVAATPRPSASQAVGRVEPAKPALPPLRIAPVPRTRATLDGRWDRDLREGRVVPDRVVDLHGCTLNAAHDRVLREMHGAANAGYRLIVVVTGKPPATGTARIDTPMRGIIRASIIDWLMADRIADRIVAIRPAHARHGGAGALYIVLRRSSSRKLS